MNSKVVNVIETLSKNFYQTFSEVDIFMKDILQWSDEVEQILKKESLAKTGGPNNILPIIHSEKKQNIADTKNNIVSSKSVLNILECGNKSITFNDTTSIKLKPALAASPTKTFELDYIKDKKNVCSKVEKKSLIIANNSITNSTFEMPQTKKTRSNSNAILENLTNETFVVPQTASTRTKPVIKKKKEKNEGILKKELENDAVLKHSDQNFQNNIFNNESIKITDCEAFNKTTNEKENLNNLKSKNSVEKCERIKISRTLSKSPAERPSKISKIYHENFAKTPINIAENLIENHSEILITPKADSENISSKKETFLNIDSLGKHNNTLKYNRYLNNSSILQLSKIIVPDTPISSPILRSSSLKGYALSNNAKESTKISLNKNTNSSKSKKVSKENNSIINRTLIKKESLRNAATFLVSEAQEKENSFNKNEKEKEVSLVAGETFTRFSKTSTPVPFQKQETTSSMESNNKKSNSIKNVSGNMQNKKKTKKEKICKENNDEVASTVRITRTKSKALQQMMEKAEAKQLHDLSVFTKKLVNKAKKNSLKKNQIVALLEKNFITPSKPNAIFSTKSKYHLLLSSTKKVKTPLATLPNSAIKIVKASNDKSHMKSKIARRDSSAENVEQEKEQKLKQKLKKEEEAATKRQNVIKSKQAELKKKNERKHQLAMKQREKLEQEKYKNMIQFEKEKEERHKLILEERQMKIKEEVFKKKMLTQQKIAETNERRRLEEEARIAKLKEMEAEEQRIALEKQKEQEMLEKRAQERLAQKKAREEYELQLKKELEAEKIKVEKSANKKLQSASKPLPSKRQKFEFFSDKKEEWDYKPRNENDYGLEHEDTVVDTDDESNYNKNIKSPVPWVKKILKNSKHYSHMMYLEMLCEYMPCFQKTPDINKMFNITPTKKIKRNSSAIWNTPSS